MHTAIVASLTNTPLLVQAWCFQVPIMLKIIPAYTMGLVLPNL